MKKPLKIYLCDLTYDTIIFVSDTIPINIGFISSFVNRKLGDKVDIELFKYPNDLLKRVEQDPPDILGLSNYSWNSNLSEYFAKITKELKWQPKVSFEDGIKLMKNEIYNWKKAPLWNKKNINKATKTWFKYMGE